MSCNANISICKHGTIKPTLNMSTKQISRFRSWKFTIECNKENANGERQIQKMDFLHCQITATDFCLTRSADKDIYSLLMAKIRDWGENGKELYQWVIVGSPYRMWLRLSLARIMIEFYVNWNGFYGLYDNGSRKSSISLCRNWWVIQNDQRLCSNPVNHAIDSIFNLDSFRSGFNFSSRLFGMKENAINFLSLIEIINAITLKWNAGRVKIKMIQIIGTDTERDSKRKKKENFLFDSFH